jgi:hypothetical protein
MIIRGSVHLLLSLHKPSLLFQVKRSCKLLFVCWKNPNGMGIAVTSGW